MSVELSDNRDEREDRDSCDSSESPERSAGSPERSAGSRPGGWLREVPQTVFRMAPWPTEAGLRIVGEPDRDSPVLVTCNYDLTVRRVMNALAGSDVWLVVAPTAGINVWCASSGGHMGTHQIVTALKTSGVEERVRHRRAILPQLAATGVEVREVSKRCGWKMRFGPVYANDLPRYLRDGQKKDATMRRVRFDPIERFEMSVTWGGPGVLILAGLAAILHPSFALPLAALTAALSLSVFFLYDRLREPRRVLIGVPALVLSLTLVAWADGGTAAFVVAVIAPLGLLALLTFDFSGSTPIEGGSHFAERDWSIVLDSERCRGVFSCLDVCPEDCFERQEEPRLAVQTHAERCIRCGACVVQCPQDALYFAANDGARIEPDTIRRFKLNLMGKRAVEIGPPDA